MYSAEFPQFVAACAILFSVVIRWLRSGASWDAVAEGRATADVLRELTGILDFDSLQETFGPPRLEDGIFPVTRREVLRQRTGLGYLFGDRWLDSGSAVIAILAVLPIWPIWESQMWLDILLAFASIYQVAGWVAAFRLVKR
ncbi:MAG: hypothetical protein B7Z38_06145 [Rhodobacterales bacterium 12-64-8]|nr:MAG: hypothetical protein B7Z38_06145 [Rhodobacterales bacterium 12-64-8]